MAMGWMGYRIMWSSFLMWYNYSWLSELHVQRHYRFSQPPGCVSPWDATGSLLSEIQTPLIVFSNLFWLYHCDSEPSDWCSCFAMNRKHNLKTKCLSTPLSFSSHWWFERFFDNGGKKWKEVLGAVSVFPQFASIRWLFGLK